MATTTVGLVQGQAVWRTGQDVEGEALKPPAVHFQRMEKGALPARAGKPSERFLPPIEDKKSAKEGNNTKVVHSFAECVPPELVLTLKRQTTPAGGTTRRSPKGTQQPGTAVWPTSLHPPANAWNHSKQRAKFKHLTDSVPCVCGAGRDISFLYDVSKQKESSAKEDQTTLIPAEFHIVQHPGVHGTEFKDSRYTTGLEEHQTHLTTFPSLNPSSRREVLALKQAYECMLEKAGVGGDTDRQQQSGPTQLHHLLELVKEEQSIFNIVFHEIIRQVSVHCVERGDLLAQLRKRYSDLLSRVPLEMKSLHNELLAQRALDRHLAEELTSFKDQVELVTKELSDVKEHGHHLTVQIGEDRRLLLEALESSQKNTSVLQEYHDLYDLQRKRLEHKIGDLKCEKDLWQRAAYKLANKITDSQDLQTVRRQQVCERSWHSLAQHFAILLSDRDTEQLLAVQEHVLTWKEAVAEFTESQQSLETQLHTEVQDIKGRLEEWSRTLDKHFGRKDSSNAEPLSSLEFQALTEDTQHWDTSLSKQYAKFAGDVLLRRQEKLQRLSEEVEAWTDEAVCIFHRHCTAHGDSTQMEEHAMMAELNSHMCRYQQQLGERVAGEDGVASGLMHVSTPLETWCSKLSLAAQSKDQRISESDWIKLHSDMKNWTSRLLGVMETLTANKDGSEGDLLELLSGADRWMKALTSKIHSRNGQIIDEVDSLHNSLTQWTVEFLLYLTCIEADEEFELMLGGMAERQTQTGLRSSSQHISDRLKHFTTKLIKCCGDVAHEIAARERKQSQGDQDGESSGSKVKDLKQMEVECQEWVRTVDLLLKDALEGTLDGQRMSTCKQKGAGMEEEGVAKDLNDSSPTKSGESPTPGSPLEGVGVEEEDNEVFVLGVDSNVYRKSLMDLGQTSNGEEFAGKSAATLGLPTVNDMPYLPADALPKPEELIVELDALEKKLKETEEAAQSTETRAVRAEQDLAAALQRVSELEKELEDSQELHKELASQHAGKPSWKQKKSTKGSTTQLLNVKKKDSKLTTKT